MKLRTLLWASFVTAAASSLAGPSLASADSGSISGVGMQGANTVQATFSVASTYCTSFGYCGYFAYARTVSPDAVCGPEEGTPIWVNEGTVQDGPGTLTQTDSWSIVDTDPFKICLFIHQAEGREVKVAETVFDPPEPAGTTPTDAAPETTSLPTSTSAPTAVPTAPRLRASTAGVRAAKALSERFGTAYKKGTGRTRSCETSSTTVVKCAVSWRYKKYRYKGTVTVVSTREAGIVTKVKVSRRRA